MGKAAEKIVTAAQWAKVQADMRLPRPRPGNAERAAIVIRHAGPAVQGLRMILNV